MHGNGEQMTDELPEGIGPVRAGFTTTKTDDHGPWVPCDLPDWHGFTVWALVDVIDGQPCVVGVRVEPKSRDGRACLTQRKLRELPLAEITAYAVREIGLADSKLAKAVMREAAAEGPEPEDPRAVTTPKQVAALYREAKLSRSRSPRQDVAEALGVHVKTISNYLSRARAEGLLPPANRKEKK